MSETFFNGDKVDDVSLYSTGTIIVVFTTSELIKSYICYENKYTGIMALTDNNLDCAN